MDPFIIFLIAGTLGTILLSPILGAESRPDWLRPDRKSSFRIAGSMRPGEWEPREFGR
jgi:hypothetical protein